MEMPAYLGCFWGEYKGRAGWVHKWADGKVLPVVRGGSGGQGQTTDVNTQGDADDNDDDDDEDDEDEDEEGQQDKASKDDDDDPVKQANAEARRRRLQAKEARQRAERAEAELNEIKNKDKPELDRLKNEHEELKKSVQTLEEDRNTWKERAIFADVAHDLGVTNTKYARFLLREDYSDLDPSDDGYEDELKDALKSVIKKNPDLVPKQTTKQDTRDDKNLAPTGSAHNSQKGKNNNQTKEQLMNKYPALRGR